MDLLFIISYSELCYDNNFFFPIPNSTCPQSNTEVDRDVLSPSGQTIVANFEAVKFIARKFLPRAGFDPRTPWSPGARSTTRPWRPPPQKKIKYSDNIVGKKCNPSDLNTYHSYRIPPSYIVNLKRKEPQASDIRNSQLGQIHLSKREIIPV